MARRVSPPTELNGYGDGMASQLWRHRLSRVWRVGLPVALLLVVAGVFLPEEWGWWAKSVPPVAGIVATLGIDWILAGSRQRRQREEDVAKMRKRLGALKDTPQDGQQHGLDDAAYQVAPYSGAGNAP